MGGLWGNFSFFCLIELKVRFWLYKKRWHTSCKFQLEIRSNKKVITKNPLTNVYEMSIRSNKPRLWCQWPVLFYRVKHPASGRFMDVYTTQPGVQFYTAYHLGNVTGKGGVVYPRFGALCLETQHYPDSPNEVQYWSLLNWQKFAVALRFLYY